MSGGGVPRPEVVSSWLKGPSFPTSGHSPSLLCNNLSVARCKSATRETGLYAFASGHHSVMASRISDSAGKSEGVNVAQLTLMRFSSSSKYFMPITQVSHVMLDRDSPIWVACGVFGAMINSGWEKQVILGKLRLESASKEDNLGKKGDWYADEFLRGVCGHGGVLYLGHSSGDILRCTLSPSEEWPTMAIRAKEKADGVPDDKRSEVTITQLSRFTTEHHQAAIMDLHTDGKTLVSCDENGVIVAWSLNGKDQARVTAVCDRWRPHACITARLIPGVNLVAAGYKTGHIRLLRPGDLSLAVEICAHAKTMTALDVARNRIVSAGEDSYCRVWCVQETAAGVYNVEQEHYVFAEDGIFTGVGFSGDDAHTYYMAMYDLPSIPSGNRVLL
ncbi:uncharacterized protein LOC135805472 [Sycon ciliatum]|uniref:uncharacterized protein LOC135805472 n=1 Tax=Sycon ciliatum TaxID=27933 RepID=UPI0020ACC5E5|eukprot:scpid72989/ scgid13322/ WD repeat-containing protein 54